MSFLLEIAHLLEITGGEIPRDVAVELAERVAKCANGKSFTLCERTMMMWQSDCWSKTMEMYSTDTFKVLLPALFYTVKDHWSEDVKKLAMSTIVAIKQSDNATLWNGQAFWCGLESERPGIGIQFCFESEEE